MIARASKKPHRPGRRPASLDEIRRTLEAPGWRQRMAELPREPAAATPVPGAPGPGNIGALKSEASE